MFKKVGNLSYACNKIPTLMCNSSSKLPVFVYLHPSVSTGHHSRRTFATAKDEGVCIPNMEVKSFIERSMKAVGTKPLHAASLAENLTMADYRGHFSHGLNRLEMYVKDIIAGMSVCDKEPEIIKETPATALVEGNNLLGTVVGTFCTELAIKKAKDIGIGLVSARGSNHYGIAGYYAMLAADHGLLGMSFTNTSPLVLPTRGRKACLGTNPLSLAAPGKNGDSFVLDMATSAVALGKIELSAVKNEKIPMGWGADRKGHLTDNPSEVVKEGGLLALGGAEVTSGYKGYGLGMLVEIFCGVLSGGQFGPKIRRWKETDRVANLGQCFIAIDPSAFAEGFQDRMQELMDLCRDSELAEGQSEILVAGDPERMHMAKCDKAGGITYHPNVIAILDNMAQNLKIDKIVRKE